MLLESYCHYVFSYNLTDQIPLAFTISLFLVATKASNLPDYYWLHVRLPYAKMQLVTLVDNRQQSRPIGCQCL